MDDRPLKSGGAYNINWDEVDEMADPFGGKVTSNSVTKSPKAPVTSNGPTQVNSKGDGPAPESTEQPSPAKTPLQPKATNSPSKPAPPARASSTKPTAPKANPVANGVENGEKQNATSVPKEPKVPTDPEIDEFPLPSPQLGPSPEQLAKALESVALKSPEPNESEPDNTAPAADKTPISDDAPAEAPVDQQPPPLGRIDSSTRPASPAQTSALWNRPSMDAEPSRLAGAPVTEDEITSLRKERDELVTTIDEMRRCIAEYDRSLQHLIEEKSQMQPQVNVSVADLISERDQAVEEVATIEKAFGDLHRRFEKSKQVIESFKQNEEALKRSIEEYKSLLQRQENKYLALKKLAEEKLLKATQDAETQRQEFEAHAARLQAALRIAELQTKSLESQLAQKTRENVELTKICDELLSRYGGVT